MAQYTRAFNALRFGIADPVASITREAEVLERGGFWAFEVLVLGYIRIHRLYTAALRPGSIRRVNNE